MEHLPQFLQKMRDELLKKETLYRVENLIEVQQNLFLHREDIARLLRVQRIFARTVKQQGLGKAKLKLTSKFRGHPGIDVFQCDTKALKELLFLMKMEGFPFERKREQEQCNFFWLDYILSSGATLEIAVFLGDDAECQLVQTGTKEVPQYELRCGDKSVGDIISQELQDDDENL